MEEVINRLNTAKNEINILLKVADDLQKTNDYILAELNRPALRVKASAKVQGAIDELTAVKAVLDQ